ncbi:hypothetical protein JCM10449v2_006722 [Rhodotorula kratochvilovae]
MPRPARSAAQPRAVSYKEIPSDDDLSSDDEGPKDPTRDAVLLYERVDRRKRSTAGRGDSYGAANDQSKKRRRLSQREKLIRKDKRAVPKLDEHILLDLPFDCFAEICSNLKSRDLIALAQVSRTLRKILLSSTNTSIWAAARQRAGWTACPGTTEISFALFVFGEHCQHCGIAWTYRPLDDALQTGVRLCYTCRKEHIVPVAAVCKRRGLHLQALGCVYQFPTSTLLVYEPELDKVSSRLHELAALDAQVRKTNRLRAGGTTRTSRSLPAMDDLPALPDSMLRFAEERRAAVRDKTLTLRVFNANYKLLVAERDQRQAEENLAASEREDRIRQELAELLTWTEEDIDCVLESWRQTAPKILPSTDSTVWISALAREKAADAKADQARAARHAVGARQDALTPYYRELQDSLDLGDLGYFPDSHEFACLPAVKKLWQPTRAHLDDDVWAARRSSIEQAVRGWSDSLRRCAVRNILAAAINAKPTTLSDDPADYPVETYGTAFFARITSQFFHHSWDGKYVCTYPRQVDDAARGSGVRNSMQFGMSYKHVFAVKSILATAELDVETVTVDEMNALGRAFRWERCPKSSERGWVDWRDMVYLIVAHGPPKGAIEFDDATVDLEFREVDLELLVAAKTAPPVRSRNAAGNRTDVA